jgi:hypothetical protein
MRKGGIGEMTEHRGVANVRQLRSAHHGRSSILRANGVVVLLLGLVLASAASPGLAWRSLWVEKDNMTGRAAPDLALFVAYGKAEVAAFGETSDTNCAHDYNLEYYEMEAFVASYKDHTSTATTWWVFLCGAYEGPAATDNDPDYESELLGYAYDSKQGATYSFIFNETIRDWAIDELEPDYNLALAKRKTALHESGHQFRLSLNDSSHACIMHSQCYYAKNYFCDTCASEIKNEGHPGP